MREKRLVSPTPLTPRAYRSYPSYNKPNIWPTEALPELEGALKACGALMVETGLLLAAHCDAYTAARASPSAARLRQSISESRCIKARLLHYFAASEATPNEAGSTSDWCGWHLDHGSLTALASAQYSDGRGEVACPDALAGLYIRARDGRVVHVRIPPHSLAFQMGESSQIHSGGLLMATPHCVRAACGPAATGVSRDTFAVFLQPHYEALMDCPPGSEARVGVPQWSAGQDFGSFSAAKVADYYRKEL
jgi:isopenicillin N synthase-like dioxygenase